jgi:short-subunit dehydrogenase
MSSESLRQQFELLFFAPLAVQQNLMARMRRGKGGLIVNVSSLAAELPIPFMGAYSAAKASFSVASAALRLEMTDERVRCVDLRPGDISTDFNQSVSRGRGSEGAAATNAWKAIEKNMAGAPPATVVAERICAIVEGRDRRPVSRVGDWFQSVLAPWGAKFLPAGLLERLIRSYYGIR